MMHICVDKPLYWVGKGERRRAATKFKGLLGLCSTEVLSLNDFICAPFMDSFSLEQAQSIATQIAAGVQRGMVDGLLWALMPSI